MAKPAPAIAPTDMLVNVRDVKAGLEERMAEIAKLRKALSPFVAAYEKAACPVGDSDLDNEQHRAVSVTLGDCRYAARILHHETKPGE